MLVPLKLLLPSLMLLYYYHDLIQGKNIQGTYVKLVNL